MPRSRLNPGQVVLWGIELFELFPCGNCLCTRRPLVRLEEVRHEIDVATVRDPLESLHLVKDDVLPDEIAVRGVLAVHDLYLSPAVEAIPDPGLLSNVWSNRMGLRDDKILCFTVAGVVLNPEFHVEPKFNVFDAA